MKISKNTVVNLHYRLRQENDKGDLIEETFGYEPLVFLFGTGNMIPAFEENLEGKEAGDSFSFGIGHHDAYGTYDPEAVVTVPIETFIVKGRLAKELLEVGRRVPMADQDGNPLDGMIKEVRKKEVVLDFNHPLAGIDLHFSGEINQVRAATESEIAHNHVHGEGGHDH